MMRRADLDARTGSAPRRFALLASTAIALALGLAGACTELKGSIGSDCIKDQDCQSGICSQQMCVAPPPYLDAQVSTPDAGADATLDGGQTPVDGSGEGASAADVEEIDASAAEDVSNDSTPDAPADADDAHSDAPSDVSPDAPADATTDAPADGPQDAGEAG
jgi:hypothetical protein